MPRRLTPLLASALVATMSIQGTSALLATGRCIAPAAACPSQTSRSHAHRRARAQPLCSAVAETEAPPRWQLARRLVRDSATGRQVERVSLESSDRAFVVRALNVTLTPTAGLGLELSELAGTGQSASGQECSAALVVVTGLVQGGAAADAAGDESTAIRVGDTIIGVSGAGAEVPTEGLPYDELVDGLRSCLQPGTPITLTLKRLVPRGKAVVNVQLPDGREAEYTAFSGENLRLGLIRRGLTPNDQTAERYDNKPAGTGDCGGNGLCCTCVVNVLRGAEHLSRAGPSERQLLRRGLRWRQSCKAKLQLNDGEAAELRLAIGPRGQETKDDIETFLGPEFERGV